MKKSPLRFDQKKERIKTPQLYNVSKNSININKIIDIRIVSIKTTNLIIKRTGSAQFLKRNRKHRISL